MTQQNHSLSNEVQCSLKLASINLDMAENPITWDDSFEMSQEAIGSYLVPDDYNVGVNDESNYIIYLYVHSGIDYFYSSQNKYAKLIYGESAEGSEVPFTVNL